MKGPDFTHLNGEQRAAVEYGDGPLIIFAGAGSGKTRVIAYRIAHLLRIRGVPASAILAITFTNKAAGELRERVNGLIANSDQGLTVSTFHAFGLRILRREAEKLGYSKSFAIYDPGDAKALLRPLLAKYGVQNLPRGEGQVLEAISWAKNRLESVDPGRSPVNGISAQVFAAIVRDYQTALTTADAMDLDDLIGLTVALFDRFPDALDRYRNTYRYLLVDEYQDTNPAQFRLVRQLAGPAGNVTVVGDDDQAIYGWRGADVTNILSFTAHFSGAHKIVLERNYRSTQPILDAATALARSLTGRAPKRLWTEQRGGELITAREFPDARAEASFVTREISARLKAGEISPNETAILYRINAQSRLFEEFCRKWGIPYRVVGAVAFYQRMEIKDVLAYLSLMSNPEDSRSLLRIFNTPRRGLGNRMEEQIQAAIGERGGGLSAVKHVLDERMRAGEALPALRRFYELIAELRAIVRTYELPDLIVHVLDKTGYLDWLRKSGDLDAQSRIENIHELISAARSQLLADPKLTLSGFLDQAALQSETDELSEAEESVSLMSLHAAKGLEFELVFITGLEEGLIPHARALAGGQVEQDEERRLLYVGMTRAKKKLFLTWAAERALYGQAIRSRRSRFLYDIPTALLIRDAAVGRSDPGVLQEAVHEFEQLRAAERKSSSAQASLLTISAAAEEFRTGDRVLHPQFGSGTVLQVRPVPGDQALTINFTRAGRKIIYAGKAGLKRLV